MAITKRKWGSFVSVFGTSGSYRAISSTVVHNSSNINFETSGVMGIQLVLDVHHGSTKGGVGIKWYGALTTQGSSHYDEVALGGINFAADANGTSNQKSIVLSGLAHARISMQSSSTSSGHTGWAYYKPWRYVTTGAN